MDCGVASVRARPRAALTRMCSGVLMCVHKFLLFSGSPRMFRFQNVLCIATAFYALASPAMASTMTWNAYDDFISGPTAQSSSNVWQYLQNADGDNNSGYIFLNKWAYTGAGVAGWRSTSPDDVWFFVAKNTANSEVRVSPWGTASQAKLASTIAWKSPVAGTVNASFTVTDRDGNNSADGVQYWLYKGGAGNADYLEKGIVGIGGTSGVITHSNISVAEGDMLYLRVGPNVTYYNDLTGISFSVTAVPEPNTLALLGVGLVSLLCYAWRKRK